MPVSKKRKCTANDFFDMIFENEFERYELIRGEITSQTSPPTLHQDIILQISTEVNNYIKKIKEKYKPCISPYCVLLGDEDVVKPDFFVVCDKSKLNGRLCRGVPDFIIEVVSNNYIRDYADKLILYRRYGVREYWITDPKCRKIIAYFFEKSDFPSVYTFDMPVPVGIFGGMLTIRLSELIN